MRLRLSGGHWPYFDVLELGPENVVVRTPSQPQAFAGHAVGFNVMSSRAVIVVEATERARRAETTLYRARILYQEPGLIAALEQAGLTPQRNPVQITHRLWRQPPYEATDEDLLMVLERAIRASGVRSQSATTAVLVVRHALRCDREQARERLRMLVDGDLIELIDRAPDKRGYRLR